MLQSVIALISCWCNAAKFFSTRLFNIALSQHVTIITSPCWAFDWVLSCVLWIYCCDLCFYVLAGALSHFFLPLWAQSNPRVTTDFSVLDILDCALHYRSSIKDLVFLLLLLLCSSDLLMLLLASSIYMLNFMLYIRSFELFYCYCWTWRSYERCLKLN